MNMTCKHIQTKANTDKLCKLKQNQCYSPIMKKQRNLGVRFQVLLLEFSPLLESCSDIYAGPTSCLIVTLLMFCFSDIFLYFFYLPSLSIYSRSANILCSQIERSLPSIITRHAPLLLIGYKCVLGLSPMLWSKAFFKNRLVHL